ncbi:MAG: tyrosine-type recombinase/integrase [Kiritimatiellaeota bacterium]|nr:tyrosine-type recombinase/integrase [Kiritimatiellota bacterium]
MKAISIRPFQGSLYKRRNGKYLSADSTADGIYYMEIPLPLSPKRRTRICLHTASRAEAEARAYALAASPARPPVSVMLAILNACFRQLNACAAAHAPAAAPPAAPTPANSPAPPRVRLSDVWFLFTQRYEAALKSLKCYRHQLDAFLRWSTAAYADEVTRPMAEEYIKHIFSRKSTAPQDISTLKRIWHTVWPDCSNPWNTGLRLKPKARDGVFRYRRLTVSEAGAFLMRITRCHKEENTLDRRRTINRLLLEDLRDAVAFAWQYGMRIGSLAALRWEDFNPARDFFLHIPPKTRGVKPWPLEIPIMPATHKILLRRFRGARGRPAGFLFPHLHHAYNRNANGLSALVKRLMVGAGVLDDHRGRATMHSFRACFITQMDEAGVPSGITDSLTGHAPQNMHDMYSHASVQSKRDWLNKAIPPLPATET